MRDWPLRLLVPVSLAAVLLVGLAHRLSGDLDGSYVVPLDHNAIRYSSLPVQDAAQTLHDRLKSGATQLEYDPKFGYLPALLKALDVPVSSQVLVFSKTSFQAPRISPRMPRALYFNDEVSVGFVRGGDVLEITAVDPRQGVIFYTLDQVQAPRPRIARRGECLQCHASGGTLGVPGLVVRSVFPERSGMPLFHAGSFVTDHRSPLAQRWGGWYVTGAHGTQRHMGNAIVEDIEKPDQLASDNSLNRKDLNGLIDTGAYLSPYSDIVALMVLEHQTRMTNMITRVGYEVRMALHDQAVINKALERPADETSDSTRRRITNATESMLRYMLFTDEAPLEGKIEGVSGFASDFMARGPKDSKGRSLRDLDLEKRLFQYPLSYMIYTTAFDGMPAEARTRIYQRLCEILSGKDQTKEYATLSPHDRQNILEILLETKPEFAAAQPAKFTPGTGAKSKGS